MQLQDENGKIPIDGLLKAREQMAVMKAAQEKKAKALGKGPGTEVAGINPGSWAWLGPGNVGGRIRSIVIDPANANNLWVGSVAGGIWHSTDAGVSWMPVNDFMGNLAVSTMVINPTNSNIMYAGTGEGFGNFDAIQGGGIFQSTDGGVTWNLLQATNPAAPAPAGCGLNAVPCPSFWSFVTRLAISPNGNTILAATNDPKSAINNDTIGAVVDGIAQSTDGGVTWTQRRNNQDLDIDFDPTSNGKAVAGEVGGASFSVDGGQTWQAATFAPLIALNGGSGRVELAYAPSNTQIVYASVDEIRPAPPAPPATPPPPTAQGNIYKSFNGGQTYTLINTTNSGGTFLGNQGFYGNILWVNPQDANFVVVGGISLFKSTDGGINWGPIAFGGNGSAHSDHHMIVSHPAFDNNTNKAVYFGNDGGIYRADDISTVSTTSGWTKLDNNLGITQFFSAAANSAGVIVGGTQDNGTQRYTPGPGAQQAWTSTFGGDGGYVAADPTDTNYFFGEYSNLSIFRSVNGGGSASYIYCNPAPTGPNGGICAPGVGIGDSWNGANFVAPFILDPNNPNTLLAGGLSLWRSNDVKAAGLPTWAAVKAVAPDTRPPPQLGTRILLALSQSPR